MTIRSIIFCIVISTCLLFNADKHLPPLVSPHPMEDSVAEPMERATEQPASPAADVIDDRTYSSVEPSTGFLKTNFAKPKFSNTVNPLNSVLDRTISVVNIDDSIVAEADSKSADQPVIGENDSPSIQTASPALYVDSQQDCNYSPGPGYQRSNNGYVTSGHPAMNVQNYNLFQYRRMMINSPSVHPSELQGHWRGINKGIATVAIDEQFIKSFHYIDGQLYGDNISVRQVNKNQLHQQGWQPIINRRTGGLVRQGKFQVQTPRGIGAFRHGAVLNYRRGGNRPLDGANLIVDRIVKLDDNHMLGRATVQLGPIPIPLAFFVLERVQ